MSELTKKELVSKRDGSFWSLCPNGTELIDNYRKIEVK